MRFVLKKFNTKILIFALIITIVSVSVFFFGIGIGTKFSLTRNDLGTKNKITKLEKYELLGKLSPDVQIGYFRKYLGDATYINRLDEYPNNFLGWEYVFVDEEYFVQAVTDNNLKVLSFTITTRTEDFNPTFQVPVYPKGLNLTLNKTSFYDAFEGDTPLSCYKWVGGHTRLYYYEIQFYGNPGLYQYYLIGNNYASNYSENDLPSNPEGSFSLGYVNCSQVDEQDRKTLTPNTYGVWSYKLDQKLIRNEGNEIAEYFLGVDPVQIRTLND